MKMGPETIGYRYSIHPYDATRMVSIREPSSFVHISDQAAADSLQLYSSTEAQLSAVVAAMIHSYPLKQSLSVLEVTKSYGLGNVRTAAR